MKRKLIALLLIVMMVSVFPAFAAENDSGPDTQETEIELKTENAEAVVQDTESSIEDTNEPAEEMQDEDVEELKDEDIKEPEESKKVEEKKPEVVKEDKNEEKSSEIKKDPNPNDMPSPEEFDEKTYKAYLRDLKAPSLKLKSNSSLVDGKTYEYSNPFNGDPDLGWYDFRVGDYVGECIDPDLSAAWGDMARNAEVSKISNTNDIAKCAYYWGVVKGWRNGDQLVSDFNKQILMLRVIQYSAQPEATINHMDSSMEATVKNMYNEAQSVTVPNSFEIYRCQPTNTSHNLQPFAVWRMAPSILIQINKSVSNTKITSKNGLYDVKGTKFKLYETESDAKNDRNAVATLTIGENGKSSTVEIDRGSYYLVETQAGPGLIIPNDLKKANAGKKIDCNGPTTINIS